MPRKTPKSKNSDDFVLIDETGEPTLSPVVREALSNYAATISERFVERIGVYDEGYLAMAGLANDEESMEELDYIITQVISGGLFDLPAGMPIKILKLVNIWYDRCDLSSKEDFEEEEYE